MSEFNPDNWLTSLHESLAEYVLTQVDESVMVGAVPSGLQAFDVVFDWPDASEIAKDAKLTKTIIHFAADDIENRILGMGENTVVAVEEDRVEPNSDLVRYHEATMHIVNFDVGSWASDQSGGSTSRMVVYETLHKIFGTEIGKRKLREAIDVDVIRFSGGRNITDRINDLRIFRMIDCELVVRVFSRTVSDPAVIVDQAPVVAATHTIDSAPIS